MFAHNLRTAAPNCMKFCMEVALAVGKVCISVLES